MSRDRTWRSRLTEKTLTYTSNALRQSEVDPYIEPISRGPWLRCHTTVVAWTNNTWSVGFVVEGFGKRRTLRRAEWVCEQIRKHRKASA